MYVRIYLSLQTNRPFRKVAAYDYSACGSILDRKIDLFSLPVSIPAMRPLQSRIQRVSGSLAW